MSTKKNMTASESAAVLQSNLLNGDIEGFEAKHIHYLTSPNFDIQDDLCMVKEVMHLKDGRTVPKLRFIKNPKIPIYITQERHRKNKDRKEMEERSKCIKYETTKKNLNRTIVKGLGFGNPKTSTRQLLRSPYVYNADMTPEVLLKYKYQKKWPKLATPNSVACFDSETDMRTGNTKNPLVFSITMCGEAYMAYYNPWVAEIPDFEDKVQKMFAEYLEMTIPGTKYNLTMQGFDSFGEIADNILKTAHEWQPDFLVAHNADFDISVLIEALTKDGFDLATSFSDPRCPDEFKSFYYQRDDKPKVSASGVVTNPAWFERWNKVHAPTSFYIACSGATYYTLRVAAGKEPSYSLDALLTKILNTTKKYIPHPMVTSEPGGVDWHRDMQIHDPVGYSVYNLFDNIELERMCERTTDFSVQISMLSGVSSYHSFTSSPRKLADGFAFHLLENTPNVMGSTSSDMDLEHDDVVIEKDGWIMTLPAANVIRKGVQLVKEMPLVHSTVHKTVADADISSTYPNGQILLNISKSTTAYELCKLEDIPYEEQILIGVNLTGGLTNSIQLLTRVVGAPTQMDLLEAYRKTL